MALTVQQRRVTVGSQIARTDIERAKVVGWANLPLGTLNGTKTEATYNAPTEYFDNNGSQLANATGAAFSLQRSVVDSNIAVSGSTYTLKDASLRKISSTVKYVPKNETIVTYATYLAKDEI
jgi:hypothetical protein